MAVNGHLSPGIDMSRWKGGLFISENRGYVVKQLWMNFRFVFLNPRLTDVFCSSILSLEVYAHPSSSSSSSSSCPSSTSVEPVRNMKFKSLWFIVFMSSILSRDGPLIPICLFFVVLLLLFFVCFVLDLVVGLFCSLFFVVLLFFVFFLPCFIRRRRVCLSYSYYFQIYWSWNISNLLIV